MIISLNNIKMIKYIHKMNKSIFKINYKNRYILKMIKMSKEMIKQIFNKIKIFLIMIIKITTLIQKFKL
jgi:hypothetical protein